jgi:hypothetical protein
MIPIFMILLHPRYVRFSSIGLGRESDRKCEQRKLNGQSKGPKTNCSLVRRAETAAESEA